MKCPNCSHEGESQFCPECGSKMVKEEQKKTCPKCGEIIECKFCPNCGLDMENNLQVRNNPENKEMGIDKKNNEDNSNKKKISFTLIKCFIVSIVIVIISLILIGYLIDSSYDNESEDNNPKNESTLTSYPNQGKNLPEGTYTVGEDIEEGKYTFIYKTSITTKDDYWGNDYIWITRANSKGSEETLGGDKYDVRYGDASFADATNGKSYFVTLNKGDTLRVDASEGSWSY